MRSLVAAAYALPFLLSLPTTAMSEGRLRVDANVVTALDASDSIGSDEERIEREGLAQAVVHPRFLEAIASGQHKQIGFAVLTWSSHGQTDALIPWTVLRTFDDAERISRALLATTLRPSLDGSVPVERIEWPGRGGLTDLAQAISLGADLLRAAPFEAQRSVMNIVGSGPSNSGLEPSRARDAALRDEFVINGVVARKGSPADVAYYRSEVIGGPGSFVMQVPEPEAVIDALAAKFRWDIVGRDQDGFLDLHLLTYGGLIEGPAL